MEIYGKERGFSLTVRAASNVARLCPGGDLSKMGEILNARPSTFGGARYTPASVQIL